MEAKIYISRNALALLLTFLLCLSNMQISLADDLQLSINAVTETLKAASTTLELVKGFSKQGSLSKPEAGIIQDCVENVGDSIDLLKQSLQALGSLNGSARRLQISNVQTWLSAALTDETTCTDEIDESKISDEVLRKTSESVGNVAKLTSNALALVNKLS